MQHNDPATYKLCSTPHATPEEATSALEAFFADLAEIRKRHRIANVVLVAEVNVDAGEDVQPEPRLATFSLGDSTRHLQLAAVGYGQQQELQRKSVEQYMRLGAASAGKAGG